MRLATTTLLLAALAVGGSGCETDMAVPGDADDPAIPDAMRTPWEDHERIDPGPASPDPAGAPEGGAETSPPGEFPPNDGPALNEAPEGSLQRNSDVPE